MWRLKAVGHKAAENNKHSLEEYKTKRRQHERAVRQARRDRQLVSKRLLLLHDEDEDEDTMDSSDSPDQVLGLFQRLQSSRMEETEVHLRALSRVLKHPDAQHVFMKQENSVHVLIRHLSGHMTQNRLSALRCLQRLSQSSNTAPYCSPAAPYLITYLSGQSPAFTELCVCVLGNLVPDSQMVRNKMLAQGLIPALDTCLQTHRHVNLAVVEAVGFTLSQLLQSSEAAESVIPSVLSSGLPEQLLSVLMTSDPQFGHAPSMEAAWCLHYLTSSDQARMLPVDTLSRCSSLLGTLGGAVAAGNTEEAVELLLWPVLRCAGNLLCCGPPNLTPGTLTVTPATLTPVTPGGQGPPPSMPLGSALRLLAALCAFAQAFLHRRPALTRESLWVLNNLTADSITLCRALLRLKLLPVLMRMLPFSEGINTMVLRVMCNMTHHLRDQMADGHVLTAVTHTLKMTDTHVVSLSLELLHMLLDARTEVWVEFVRVGGVSLLEVIQFNEEEELRTRAAFLLDKHHHLTSDPLIPLLKASMDCGALRWSGRAFHSRGAAEQKPRSPMDLIHTAAILPCNHGNTAE